MIAALFLALALCRRSCGVAPDKPARSAARSKARGTPTPSPDQTTGRGKDKLVRGCALALASQLSIVGLLSSLYPVSTLLLATLLLRERLSKVQLPGVAGVPSQCY
jgi:hypothetical protein